MALHPDHPVERFFAALPGWLFLLGALALMGMTLLTPPWLHAREMAWEKQLMEAQLAALQRQHERYQQFYEALEAHDPVLLERLALTHLRLKPTDKQLFENTKLTHLTPQAVTPTVDFAVGPGATPTALLPFAAVEAWLAEPMPVVGVDVPAPSRLETRLTRLTRGRNRVGLFAAAMLCFLGALWYGPGHPGRQVV